jgi:membrane protein implicated in regulation of membrane protease activity
MELDAEGRRRWLSGIALGGSLLMLVIGETALKGKLGAFPFVIYWLGCLTLLIVAFTGAIRLFRMVQERTREEQKKLLDETLKKIQADAKTRPQRRGSGRR